MVEYAPLFPEGFHDIGESDLVRVFVLPFEDRRRRWVLCQGLRTWLRELKKTGIKAEVWLNGSFATRKPDPDDVNLVCAIDAECIDKLDCAMQERMNELLCGFFSKSAYYCHAFYYLRNNADRFYYWKDWSGHDRNRKIKGIPRIFIGGKP